MRRPPGRSNPGASATFLSHATAISDEGATNDVDKATVNNSRVRSSLTRRAAIAASDPGPSTRRMSAGRPSGRANRSASPQA